MDVEGIELTQGDVGVLYGVTTRTVRNWEDDGLSSRAEGNRKFYRLVELVRWHEAREVARALESVDTSAMDAAKLRKLEAEAAGKELDLSIKRGELVPMEEVERLVREALETVAAILRHAPSRFAPKLAKLAGVGIKEARTILEDIVEAVRGAVREDEPDA